MIVSKEI